jgi:DNA mismatch repair protein MutL
MSKIKILPENIANQIAAGEVVERPASVVKEFVENGIDAGATLITVEVEGGGVRLIRVIDNGEGMDADDVLLCLERHGTSKIRHSDDLVAISTLGFRGEAVPSIGSVSKLTIISKRAEEHLGCQAVIQYGTIRKVHEMGCSQGTIMEVRQLFGNVPARRKFLKTTRTELSHIDEVMVAMSLSHPHIGFRYQVDGRIGHDFPQGGSLRDRVCQIYKMAPATMVEVDSGDEVLLTGYLAAPDSVTGVAAKLRVFVNGRLVRDRMVNHAVSEGAHGFYLKGRRPSGVLMISVPPHTVDVNVHPTKQEIRFHRSQDVHQAIVTSIRQSLTGYQSQVKNELFGKVLKKDDSALASTVRTVATKEVPPPTLFESQLDRQPEVNDRPMVNRPEPVTAVPPVSSDYKAKEEVVSEPKDEPVPSHPLGRLTYLGQFQRSYILCESENGLVVIDQHAAHERLIFENLKKQIMGAVVTQNLLFPEMVSLSRRQVKVVEQYGEEISRLGLEIDHFGGDSYAIKAVPALLGHIGPLEIVTGVLDQYLQQSIKTSRATRLEDMLAVMACKAAVKANHSLLPEEGVALLQQMLAADVFSHCPHGRPVYQLFTGSEVKKWFLRT